MKTNPLREGKAKILYYTNHPSEHLIQHFKDDATAFNAQKKGQIRDKGVLNNQVSTWVFKYLEKHGIPTHFVDKISDREMLIKKVRIENPRCYATRHVAYSTIYLSITEFMAIRRLARNGRL